MRRHPVVFLQGPYESDCGYCKHRDTSHKTSTESNPSSSVAGHRSNYGIFTQELPASHYQQLLNRNWRRCGQLYYCPYNEHLCCPQYAIRCLVSGFQWDKSHLKTIKGLNSKLKRAKLPTTDDMMEDESSSGETDHEHEKAKESSRAVSASLEIIPELESRVRIAIQELAKQEPFSRLDITKLPVKIQKIPVKTTDSGGYCSSVALAIAGHLKKLGTQDGSCNAIMIAESIRKHLVDSDVSSLVTDIQISKHGHLNFTGVHMMPEEKPPATKHSIQKKDEPITPHYKLTLTMTSSTSVKQDEFQLYKRYQHTVHGDPDQVTERSYDRFLCHSSLPWQQDLDERADNASQTEVLEELQFEYQITQESPFFRLTPADFTWDQLSHRKLPFLGYGSFHIRYELHSVDDSSKKPILVAVSVVDCLPEGLSSVYFFYDPDYKNWSLGTASALLEIQLQKHLVETLPTASPFKYYFLGYYIHECKKMRYKARFGPNEILDPVAKQWTPLSTEALTKLDQKRYCCLLNKETKATDPTHDANYSKALNQCYFLVGKQIATGKIVQQALGHWEGLQEFMVRVNEFHRLTNHETWQKLILVVD